jgi:hypothetical protein
MTKTKALKLLEAVDKAPGEGELLEGFSLQEILKQPVEELDRAY